MKTRVHKDTNHDQERIVLTIAADCTKGFDDYTGTFFYEIAQGWNCPDHESRVSALMEYYGADWHSYETLELIRKEAVELLTSLASKEGYKKDEDQQ